jgi:hypothetical protein
MDMKQLIELMKEDRLEVCSSNDVDLDASGEFQLIHVPTLRKAFRGAVEEEVREGAIDEAEDCNKCIGNYLVALDKAVRASKGSLKRGV